MTKGVTILGLLVLLLSCKSENDASEHELGLVYNVLRDVDIDNYEVFSMNLDGTDKKNITDLYNVEWTYYSYEDTLYFISDRGACKRCYFLYKSNFNGENVQKVTDLEVEDSCLMIEETLPEEVLLKLSEDEKSHHQFLKHCSVVFKKTLSELVGV